MDRGQLRRQAAHQPAEAPDPRQGDGHHHHREGHEDHGLQEVGDDHRPQAADHAVGQDHHSGAEDGPDEGQVAGRGHEEAEPVEHAGPGEELEEHRAPGEGLARTLVEALHGTAQAAVAGAGRPDDVVVDGIWNRPAALSTRDGVPQATRNRTRDRLV